jgi:hypothetical protein
MAHGFVLQNEFEARANRRSGVYWGALACDVGGALMAQRERGGVIEVRGDGLWNAWIPPGF